MGNSDKGRKKLPPEEFYNTPQEYYQGDILYNYTRSKSMMRTQEKITKRAIEILGDPDPTCRILDIGMGCGFSTSYLYLNGYNVLGIDLIYEMLNSYKISELNPINADMKYLPFRNNTFDYVISISAMQWIINKLNPSERSIMLRLLAGRLKNILKLNGKAVIQLYTLSQDILKDIGRTFAEFGEFEGNFIIDNPKSNVKKKIYLFLEKC
jgi:SAM-dependent methyltransferase